MLVKRRGCPGPGRMIAMGPLKPAGEVGISVSPPAPSMTRRPRTEIPDTETVTLSGATRATLVGVAPISPATAALASARTSPAESDRMTLRSELGPLTAMDVIVAAGPISVGS